MMCESMLPDEFNSFYDCFDILNKGSAVKSTLRGSIMELVPHLHI